jgi:hypothetical protein
MGAGARPLGGRRQPVPKGAPKPPPPHPEQLTFVPLGPPALPRERAGTAGQRANTHEENHELRDQDADAEEDQAEEGQGAGQETESVTCVDVIDPRKDRGRIRATTVGNASRLVRRKSSLGALQDGFSSGIPKGSTLGHRDPRHHDP